MLEYILFDLDNTLYPKSLSIFDSVVERIKSYMEVRMGMEMNMAIELRQKYVTNYGSTLRGLMTHHNIDPEDYLLYVHDVGVEGRLCSNPALAGLLKTIPINKAIFTSGHHPHAKKVLQCLGIEEYFTRIFDITFTKYIPKPDPQPYHQILKELGAEGGQCMMIEDMLVNLEPAKKMGMTTVLVGQNTDGFGEIVDYEISDILELERVLEEMGII